MLIAGAGGHAKDLLAAGLESLKPLVFFDDISHRIDDYFMHDYPICKTLDGTKKIFKYDPRFILGIGGTNSRRKLYQKMVDAGGEIVDFIAPESKVGDKDMILQNGLNIMPFAFVSNSVSIGKGTLVNTRSSLHHDVEVGHFCDIAPMATLLGGAKIGNLTFVGANATILPGVAVGDYCTIGAGAVVTEDVPDYSIMAGVPARKVGMTRPEMHEFVLSE